MKIENIILLEGGIYSLNSALRDDGICPYYIVIDGNGVDELILYNPSYKNLRLINKKNQLIKAINDNIWQTYSKDFIKATTQNNNYIDIDGFLGVIDDELLKKLKALAKCALM